MPNLSLLFLLWWLCLFSMTIDYFLIMPSRFIVDQLELVGSKIKLHMRKYYIHIKIFENRIINKYSFIKWPPVFFPSKIYSKASCIFQFNFFSLFVIFHIFSLLIENGKMWKGWKWCIKLLISFKCEKIKWCAGILYFFL